MNFVLLVLFFLCEDMKTNSQRYQCVHLKTSVWRQVSHMFMPKIETNEKLWVKAKPFANIVNQMIRASL